MSVRKPFTFTSTPESRSSRTTLRELGYKLGDTVYTSSVNTDGSLRPDSDREVYAFRDETGSAGAVYVLASTLSPKITELAPGTYKIATAPTFNLYGSTRTFGAFGDSGPKIGDVVTVTGPAGEGYGDDVKVTGMRSGWRVSASCLTPVIDTLKVGDTVEIARPAKTTVGGYVNENAFGKTGTVKSGPDAAGDFLVSYPGGTYGQWIGLAYLTKTDDTLKVGDRVEYIGTETTRHRGKSGVLTEVPRDQTAPYGSFTWIADGDTAGDTRFSYRRNLRKSTTPAPAPAPTLTAGQYVVTATPVYGSSPLPVTRFGVGQVVTLEEGLNTPDVDGDVRVRDPRGSGLVWVRASALSPIVLPTVPATPAAEPSLAERFPVGRLVVTAADPKTKNGSYVAEEFRGVVATIKGTTFGDVRLGLPNGERPYLTNIVGPEHLTLLPEGVELVKPVVREPLTFPAAYAKAVEHRGVPSSAKQVAKATKLAELLIEVSK